MLGLWAPRTKFIEVFVVSDNATAVDYKKHYVGIYQLMDKITQGKSRVDVEKKGGAILKLDKYDPGDTVFTLGAYSGPCTDMPDGKNHRCGLDATQNITVAFPDDVPADMVANLTSFLQLMQAALYDPKVFEDPVKGYRAFIDVDSFVIYLLVVEITNNIDAYRFSTFFNKPSGQKLRAGPLWDYNQAYANVWPDVDGSASGFVGWRYERDFVRWHGDSSRWFYRLMESPSFKARMAQIWYAARENGALSNSSIVGIANGFRDALLVNNSQGESAAARNFKKWDVLGKHVSGTPPSMEKLTTYAEYVDQLSTYVLDRAAWIDTQLIRPQTLAPVPAPSTDAPSKAPATPTAPPAPGVTPAPTTESPGPGPNPSPPPSTAAPVGPVSPTAPPSAGATNVTVPAIVGGVCGVLLLGAAVFYGRCAAAAPIASVVRALPSCSALICSRSEALNFGRVPFGTACCAGCSVFFRARQARNLQQNLITEPLNGQRSSY